MRFPLAIALVFSASTVLAQANLWSHVSTQPNRQRLHPTTLFDAQSRSLAVLLRKQKPEDVWECEGSDLDDLIKGLRFEAIPLSEKQTMVLVEAGSGCARGGQGANGAMWLVRFDRTDGTTPTLLATPKEFSGWLYSIQPSTSHGYPDIVLGWHMSAAEANLSYFRFDGKSYHCIGTASLVADGQENERIVPALR
jgi:hypothetical protein